MEKTTEIRNYILTKLEVGEETLSSAMWVLEQNGILINEAELRAHAIRGHPKRIEEIYSQLSFPSQNMSFGIIKLELTSADLERMKERRFRTAVAQLEEIAQEGGRPIPALYHRLESSWNAGISRLEQQIYTSFSADVSLDVVRERISRLGRIVDENRLKEQARKVFRTMDEPFHEENWEQEWKLKVEESQRNMNETAETEQDIER